RMLIGVFGLASLTWAGGVVAQQSYPTRTITMIYPYAAGAADALFRLICSEAASRLGQSIVVENRPGANGHLGRLAQQNAKGDGHVLSFVGGNALTVDVLRDPNWRIQPGRDYTPITTVFFGPYIVLISPHAPYRDMKGFVAYAKANPGKMNVAFGSL